MKKIFGVTGGMGAGKTYILGKFQKFCSSKKLNFTHIDVDEVRRLILQHSSLPSHRNIRRKLARQFDVSYSPKNSALDLEDLRAKIFKNKAALTLFNHILSKEIKNHVQKRIQQADGIIAVEWAMLITDDFLPVVDHNVLLVRCNKKTQKLRLKNGDLPTRQIQQRLALQPDSKQMLSELKKRGVGQVCGNLWTWNNNDSNKKSYTKLFKMILNDLETS